MVKRQSRSPKGTSPSSKRAAETDASPWTCVIEFFDPDYDKPCPRCAKPCRWGCTITVWPRGPIRQGTIHWPICGCPDDHIRKAIVEALAAAVVKDLVADGTLAPR